MSLLLFWPLFGVLIGLAAAQKKGFSMAGGVIGGLLLGFLAPLMFLVSPTGQKCPHCAEWIQKDAAVCRFCMRAVSESSVVR